jgi:hypothetical protein
MHALILKYLLERVLSQGFCPRLQLFSENYWGGGGGGGGGGKSSAVPGFSTKFETY